MSSFVATLDTREQDAYLRRFTTANLEKVLASAAAAGGRAGAKVLRGDAPLGQSPKPSQWYRRNALPHGTFRLSVKAAKIRDRRSALKGLQGRTVGQVIGPMGRNAFTRYWREDGFRHYKTGEMVSGTHWLANAAPGAFSAASAASEAVILSYE